MYRANLYQKNIPSQMESESVKIAINFHHALVQITSNSLIVGTLDGKRHEYKINYAKKDFIGTTHIGQFENGQDFRLIQPTGTSLVIAKSKHNALGAFTLGSTNPDGWAIHFYLTDKNDIRQTKVKEKRSKGQIQRLIEGSMMSIQFGIPQKFIELSKRLLPMVSSNPSQLYELVRGHEFVQIMKDNMDQYDYDEQEIIINISTSNKL